MIEFITYFLLAVILIGIIYQFISMIVFTSEIKKNNQKTNENKLDKFPYVSILKPLKGIDDDLKKNLISFCALDYPSYELIFGIQDYEDPALNIVNELRNEFTNFTIKVVVNPYEVGLNPKINNLYNMYPEAEGEYIFVSDSNTRVEPDFLKNMMGEFNNDNVGVVTASFIGIGGISFFARMENLHLNTFINPGIFMAKSFPKIPIVVGKAFIVPRKLLDGLGGFKAFKNYQAEDYLLGVKLNEQGYQIDTTSFLISSVNESVNLQQFIARFKRWGLIRKEMKLFYYLLEPLANKVLISFLMIFLLNFWYGFGIFLGVWLISFLLNKIVSKAVDIDLTIHDFIAIPVKDILIILIWILTFFNNRINWRGHTLKIGKDTILEPV
jgi:ceramide glucosyltransferase